MLQKKVEKICNEQIEKEAYSSQLYLAMASWAENQGFEGIASWLYAQSDEERMHMMKFIHFVNERGGKAIIPELKKPPVEYKGVNELFKEVMEHEKYITASINDIVDLTVEEKDYSTNNWIQWFVSEQMEEEASVEAILDKLNLMGGHNLYMFDRDIMKIRSEEAE